MVKIVDTPISLRVKDNRISLRNSEDIYEVIEMNSYPVEIYTDENLEGCHLVLKQYGSTSLEENGDTLFWRGERLIKLSYKEEEEEKKDYWGILKYKNKETRRITIQGENAETGELENLSVDIIVPCYETDLYKYVPLTQTSPLPTKDKIIGYEKQIAGGIEGYFLYDSDENEYNFITEKIFMYTSAGEKNYIYDSSVSGSNISTFNIIIDTDFLNIPEPLEIDDEIIVPSVIKIDAELPIENEAIELEKKELNFSYYDRDNNFYYYQSPFEHNLNGTVKIEGYIQLKLFSENLEQYELFFVRNLNEIENENIVFEATNIDLSNFSFSKKKISKEQFIEIQNNEEINVYTTEIPAEKIPNNLERFLVGLRKKEKINGGTDEVVTYITDAIEIKVLPSIENLTWGFEGEIVNTINCIVGDYNEDENEFHINSDGQTVSVLGNQTDIYISTIITTDTSGEVPVTRRSVAIYKWNPKDGFYRIDEGDVLFDE